MIPFRLHRGCEQKPESPAAGAATSGFQFPVFVSSHHRPWDEFNQSFTASWGPNKVQNRDNYTGKNTLVQLPYQK